MLPGILRGEVVYPRRSRDVWTTVARLMRHLGFGAEKRDDTHQLWITNPRGWMPGLPDARALGLPETHGPERIRLNVFVAPMEPA